MTLSYKTLKHELENAGEVIGVTDAGQTFELHLEDVEFRDASENIWWDAGDERWVLDGECFESLNVHSSHKIE